MEELGGVASVGFAETEEQGSGWLTSPDGQWDLAIVDLFLKQGSGLGVIQACKDRKAHQKVVVLTNYATPDIRTRCTQLGVDAVRQVNGYRCLDRFLPGAAKRLTLTRDARQSKEQISRQYSAYDCP